MPRNPTSDRVAETLFGKARRRVLGLLYGRPGEAFYLREIVRLTELGVGSVQRELAALTEAGLLTRRNRGNQVHFRANSDSPVFDDLRRLVEKTTGLADQVRAALAPLADDGGLKFAFIFGSVASGRQDADSDVDLMVIGDVRLSDVVPVLRPVEDRIGREINPSVHTLAELRWKAAAGDHFVRRVLEGPRMTLVGSDDELGDLARQSMADPARDQSAGSCGPARRRRP